MPDKLNALWIDFEVIAHGWIAQKNKYPWDTSLLKIIDNLVIGAKKQKA